MRITNKLYQNQNSFRYRSICTPLTPKSLNTAVPSNSVNRIFSLTGSSPLRKRPVLSVPSYGSSSILHFGLSSLQNKLYCGSSSSGLAANCFFYPSSPVNNHLLVDSLCGLPSRFKFESHFCYSLTSLFKRSLYSLMHNSHNVCSESGWLHCGKIVRCYTVSSSNSTFVSDSAVESEVQRNNSPRKFVVEVVDMVRNNGEDLESRLKMLHSRLNTYSITEIFELLNSQKISGLRFFEWMWSNDPKLHKNARVCSLIIGNLGRLEDYGTMYAWLRKFTSEKICLTYEAFGFLPVLAFTDASLKESTKRVLDLLNEVGGSCRSSGVCALIDMFCKLHLFEMAMHVIKFSGSKNSYYCLLIREKCRSGLTEDAHSIIREMRRAGCAPITTVYNYLLGSLWKNCRMNEASALLDEMKENDIPLDEITFEILINFACSLGNMDTVHQLLGQMVAQGLEPRLSTHACIIKSLFDAEKYEAAYKHAVDSSVIYKTSSNMIYSLMAKLYQQKGDIMSAQNTLVDMMEKGLKPDFSIYINIVKQLRRTGRAALAGDLESRHSKFIIKLHVARL